MSRETEPCPFHGTVCEYVPLAHKADALQAEVERLREALANTELVRDLHYARWVKLQARVQAAQEALMDTPRAALKGPTQ